MVVAEHDPPEPCTDLGRAMVLQALKLSLDDLELRDHALLPRKPPDDEGSVMDPQPTVVSEAQKRKGLWFPLSMLLPVSSGEPPEFDQSCLVRM
jgi:hypothetical protein